MQTLPRLVIAFIFAFTYAFCGFGAAGFGEGWIPAVWVGFIGCLFLGFAVNNGLRQSPSRSSAVFHLLLAIGSTIALYIATQQEGIEYFHKALNHAPEAVIGFLVGLVAFYIFPILALLRGRHLTPSSSGKSQAIRETAAHDER